MCLLIQRHFNKRIVTVGAPFLISSRRRGLAAFGIYDLSETKYLKGKI